MKIELNRADGSITTFELPIAAADIDLESDYARTDGELTVTGEVSAGDPVTVISADVKAPLLIDCSRCLREIPMPMEFGFRTAFITSQELTDEQEVELDLQDLELSFSEEEEVDLVDVVREQIILALPANPLCKEDCKGLCEICGGNLNEVGCDCKQEETDPRWAALKKLK